MSVPSASALDVFRHDAQGRYKAIDNLKAAISNMQGKPVCSDRDAMIKTYQAKLKILEGFND